MIVYAHAFNHGMQIENCCSGIITLWSFIEFPPIRGCFTFYAWCLVKLWNWRQWTYLLLGISNLINCCNNCWTLHSLSVIEHAWMRLYHMLYKGFSPPISVFTCLWSRKWSTATDAISIIYLERIAGIARTRLTMDSHASNLSKNSPGSESARAGVGLNEQHRGWDLLLQYYYHTTTTNTTTTTSYLSTKKLSSTTTAATSLLLRLHRLRKHH